MMYAYCKRLAKRLRHLREERGAVLVVVAAAMLGLTSGVALAVDVGLMTTARVEAQRAADASALAGAGGLVQSPGNSDLARYLADAYASENIVRHVPVALQPEDITVDLDELTVTVYVYRVEERDNAISTFFARVFGVSHVDISAMATAEAAPAGGVNCLLPVAMPDRWEEADVPGNDPKDFNPELGDYYVPWVQAGTDPPVYNTGFTGYSDSDLGLQVTIKSNSGGGNLNSSWYYPWRPYAEQGAEDYEGNVRHCVDPSVGYQIGMEVETEPGNMTGPTVKGFEDLINLDPTARWNASMNCVVSAGYEGSLDPSQCRGSPRIRPIPMFDPRAEPDLGNKPFTFTNFVGLFVESIQGNSVMGRWVGYTGVAPASPDDESSAGPLFKVVRLIE